MAILVILLNMSSCIKVSFHVQYIQIKTTRWVESCCRKQREREKREGEKSVVKRRAKGEKSPAHSYSACDLPACLDSDQNGFHSSHAA